MEQKLIEGCPGYAITSDGRVWSFKTNKYLKQKIDRYGYPCVSLSINNKNKTKTVHRLVAEAFIPNIENKPTVNHKDENKLNNSVDNLEWMTVAENNCYGTHYERSSKTQQGKSVSDDTRRKLSEANMGHTISDLHKEILRAVNTGANSPRARVVYCVELDEVFQCISDASRKYGIDKSRITKCCRGKCKTAGKHPVTNESLHWEYC